MSSVLIDLDKMVEENYFDIRDIVESDDAGMLEKFRDLIVKAESTENIDESKISHLCKVYLSIYEVAALRYRDAVGTVYQCESLRFIERCINNRDEFFNTEGRFIKFSHEFVICIRLKTGTCIDFVFGNGAMQYLTAEYYILFRREDMSDFDIFQNIFQLVSSSNGFSHAVAKKLLAEGVMHVSCQTQVS